MRYLRIGLQGLLRQDDRVVGGQENLPRIADATGNDRRREAYLLMKQGHFEEHWGRGQGHGTDRWRQLTARLGSRCRGRTEPFGIVATVASWGQNGAFVDADSRSPHLIAAAPEMLRAALMARATPIMADALTSLRHAESQLDNRTKERHQLAA